METDRKNIQRSLRLSILDGLFHSIMVGAGESYFVPYALFLGGSNLMLGLFVACGVLVGSLTQIFSERLLHMLGTRKRLICAGATLQILLLVPIMFIHGSSPAVRPELFLLLASAFQAAGLMAAPSWNSLMGDLVDENERGSYFSKRSKYIQITSFVSIVCAGLILSFFKGRGEESCGFVSIFSISAVARMLSLVFLMLHWEPPMKSPPTRRTLSRLVETFQNLDQRVLIFYMTLMNFAVNLSAPYFSAFMLRAPEEGGLGWSYATFTFVNAITVLFKFIFLPVWGIASDRFGSRKCLALAAWLLCTLPVCWLLPAPSMKLYFMFICLAQAWGGFTWAGHELSSFHFLMDSAHAAARPSLVASMNTVNGIMVFLGSSLGGIMVSVAAPWANPFLFVFFLSTVSRFAVATTLVSHLREVRIVEKISYRSLFFKLSGARAQMGPTMRFFVFPLRRSK